MINLGAALAQERNDLCRRYKRDTFIIVALLLGYTAFIALFVYLCISTTLKIIRILLILYIISTSFGLLFGIALLCASVKWHHADLRRLDDIEKGENGFENQALSIMRYNTSVSISATACGMAKPIIYVIGNKFVCKGRDKFYPSLDIWKQLLDLGYTGGPVAIQEDGKDQLYGLWQKEDIMHVYFANLLGNVVYHATFDVETDYLSELVGTFSKVPYKYRKYEFVFPEGTPLSSFFDFMSQAHR